MVPALTISDSAIDIEAVMVPALTISDSAIDE